eukprot:scaffold3662_cov94-Alexandrium_tamarense.AAC.3
MLISQLTYEGSAHHEVHLSRQWAMLISQLTCKGSAHHEVHSETYQGNGQCWAMLDMGNAA